MRVSSQWLETAIVHSTFGCISMLCHLERHLIYVVSVDSAAVVPDGNTLVKFGCSVM